MSDLHETDRESRGDVASGAELVFAVCHEIGNCVGGVRLHAHLLDDTMGPRELALASVELDDLAARASWLLSLVRPLLFVGATVGATVGAATGAADATPSDAAHILSSVSTLLEEHGGRGTALRFAIAEELKASPHLVAFDRDVLQALLASLALSAMEAGEGSGRVELCADVSDEDVCFRVEDDAPVSEDPLRWREQMMRGRPLLCAVADGLLTARGGHFEVTRKEDVTSILLFVPRVDG